MLANSSDAAAAMTKNVALNVLAFIPLTFPLLAHVTAPEPQLMSNSLPHVQCAAKNNNNGGIKERGNETVLPEAVKM